MAIRDGCYASLVLLTVGSAETSEGLPGVPTEFFCQCLEKIKGRNQLLPSGLASSHLAVLADEGVQQAFLSGPSSKLKSLFGRWLCLSPDLAGPERTRHRYQCPSTEELENISNILSSSTEGVLNPVSSMSCWSKLAAQIHSLLDRAPWKPEEHAVLDVHWLLAGSHPPSPCSAKELYGSLLRLQEWHGAYIQLVCNGSQNICELREWRDLLDTPPLRNLSDWLVTPSVIWRGALHFTEHKVPKLGKLSSVAFPGFALSLAPDLLELEEGVSPAVLDAIGGGRGIGQPSHLEVIQPVSLGSFPLVWRSPVHCTLFLANSAFQDSVILMRNLLTSSNNQTTGILVRLCFKEEKAPPKRSTSDWLLYVQEKEEAETLMSNARSPSPLASYLPGPLLLVCPSGQLNSSSLSCDAWFLWKPESLSTTILTSTKALPFAADDTTDEGNSSCPDPIAMATSYELDKFWDQLSSVCHELDHPPSEWPEMKALQTHEWIQSKVIHRLATPDLMFGQMVAPPPSTMKESTSIGDLISHFKESGSPAVSELSPIAMSEPSLKIHDPGEGDVTYEAIAASTPSSKKNYHGVSYCLSSVDTSMDSRLTRVQQRFITRESASNCSTSDIPRAERQRKRRASVMLEGNSAVSEMTNTKNSIAGPAKKKECSKLTPRKLTTNLVIKLPKMGIASTAKAVSLRPSKKEQGNSTAPIHEEEMEGQSQPTSQSLPVTPERRSSLDTKAKQSHTDSLHLQNLRRSPRVRKMKAEANKRETRTSNPEPCSSGGTHGKGKEEHRSSPRKPPTRKEPDSNKKRLERIVVVALKKNHMSRGHPCFRKCYTRLFNLSKIFLKDVKSSGRLKDEMERVVNLNVAQVIDFEQRQAGLEVFNTDTER